MLFHYHFWTPYLEETEKFYEKNGFRVSLRSGRYQNDFQTFNPPLTWDDFRGKTILFRIIEMRRGAVNITFGYGMKIKFDHIGFLISNANHSQICQNAQAMNWKTNIRERRTFIGTPYGFRIELQTNWDAVDALADPVKIEALKIIVPTKGLEKDLSLLFGKPMKQIQTAVDGEATIKEAVINGLSLFDQTDPNGVTLSTPD